MPGEQSDGREKDESALRKLPEAEDQGKCDLAQPGCSPCQKAGWLCPGYDTQSLFHQHVVAPAKKPENGSQRRRRDGPKPGSLVHRMPVSPTDKLRSELVHKGQAGQLSARFIVLPSVRIMEHLPSHLGEDRALDDAVQLICASDPADSMRKYGIVLRSLQDSIDRGISSEALGAATLLQMHDVYQVTSFNTWAVHARGSINMHAQGVIQMLKARGPQAIKTGFDSCLLQAQVGNITFDALRKRIPCFLALQEWNAKLKAFNQPGGESGGKYSWEMSLIPIGVHFPVLICRFEDLQSRRKEISLSCASAGLADPLLSNALYDVRQELDQALKIVPEDAVKMAPQASVANRMKPALLLASHVYLLMLDYMIEETQNGSGRRVIKEGLGGPTINLAHLTHVLTLDATKRLYNRLQEIDAVALQSTADMLMFTMDRMLDATDDVRYRTGAMAMVLEDVYEMLSPPSHRQHENRFSQDEGPRPTLGDWVEVART